MTIESKQILESLGGVRFPRLKDAEDGVFRLVHRATVPVANSVYGEIYIFMVSLMGGEQ